VGDDLDGLWAAFRASGGLVERNRLVEAYFDVALKVAKGFRARLPDSRVADFDDLVGYATEGLIAAIGSYDPLRGVPFEAYARLRVAGHVRDALRACDVLSRRDRQTVRAYTEGRHLSGEKRRRAERLVAQRPRPADSPVDERQVADTAEVLARLQVAELLDLLDATEALVVEYRYLRGMSLSAIGATLAVGESLAGQIHRTAIARLRLAGGRERPGAAAS